MLYVKNLYNKKKKFEQILNLAKKKDKLIFECFMYSYHPVFKYVKKLIRSKNSERLDM